jgi:hypothetical protein
MECIVLLGWWLWQPNIHNTRQKTKEIFVLGLTGVTQPIESTHKTALRSRKRSEKFAQLS